MSKYLIQLRSGSNNPMACPWNARYISYDEKNLEALKNVLIAVEEVVHDNLFPTKVVYRPCMKHILNA